MIISPSDRANSVEEYFFSKKLKQIKSMQDSGIDILNLGIGNPDLPPPPQVLDKLVSAASQDSTHGYQSYIGIPQLRKAFADWYQKYFDVKLNPDNQILPLMGSKEGIMHISAAFVNPGDGVLIPDPGYPTYESVSKIVGAKIIKYKLKHENNWLPDLQELARQDLSGVKIMWINYPNMPTGAAATNDFFKDIIEFGLKHKILIINDNPYSFILNDNYKSILKTPRAFETALELNSVSKAHNMAGWRVGAVLGHQDYITEILKIKSNMDSGMFLPVQLAAVEALKSDEKWFRKINSVYKERQKYAHDILDLLNCEYDKTAGGMFVWAKIPEQYKDGFELSDKLLNDAHVFITPGGIFGEQGKYFIRISLCSTKETLQQAKERILNQAD